MRGVEAGMGMVNVTSPKTGKLLNSGRRQRREEQSTQYGRRISSCGQKNRYMVTQAEHPQTGDAQAADANAASSQGASKGTFQPGSFGGGVVGSVGVDSSPSPF